MTDLPTPLVHADLDLRDFAFMPLDVARLRDSDLAANETPEACWAAVLLWSASWHQVPAASIPDDDRWIAKQAGYAQRGKIDREWSRVRGGALRNWVKCSDGRLYHPVVAEKAIDAWYGKMRQRFATECARIKKHNQRHGTNIACPTFEEWKNAGCPQGQELRVPRDANACPEDSGGDNASKGQGQGQTLSGKGVEVESGPPDEVEVSRFVPSPDTGELREVVGELPKGVSSSEGQSEPQPATIGDVREALRLVSR